MSFASWRRWLRRSFAPRANTTTKKPVRARLAVERLEERLAPVNRVFDNDNLSGDWSDPVNWSGDILPGSGDTAVFDTVTVDPVYVDGSFDVGAILFTNSTGFWNLVPVNPGDGLTIWSPVNSIVQDGGAGSNAVNSISARISGGIAANIVNGSLELTNSANSMTGSMTVQANGELIATGTSLGTTQIILNGGQLTLNGPTFGQSSFVSGGLDGRYYNVGAATTLIDPASGDVIGLDALTPTNTILTPRVDFGTGTEAVPGDGSVLDRGGSGGNPYGGIGATLGGATDNISGMWTGYIDVPANGTYQFTTRSDDGSRIWVDIDNDGSFAGPGELVADRNFFTGMSNTTGPVTALTAGLHAIKIASYEGGGGAGMQASWQGITGSVFAREIIPPTALFTGGLVGVNNVQVDANSTIELAPSLTTAALGNLTFNTSTPNLQLTVNGLAVGPQILRFTGTTLLNQSIFNVGDADTTVELKGTVSANPPGTGAQLTKTGPGTLLLSNSTNDYTGQTVINAGRVAVNANNALGFTGAGNDTIVNSGGQLDFRGPNYTAAEAVTITGTGPGGTGAIHSTGGSFRGPITATNGTNSIVSDGNFSLYGGITTQGGELQFGGSGMTELYGQANPAGPDEVWIDDATPPGVGLGGTWAWSSGLPAPGPTSPYSGSQFHFEPGAGWRWHYFGGNGAYYLPIFPNDTLFQDVYLTPTDLPSELELTWYDGITGWRNVYWGPNFWAFGNTNTQISATLPASGAWVRLDIPAYIPGLENRYAQYGGYAVVNGTAAYDRSGVKRAVAIAETAPTSVRKLGNGVLRVNAANLYSGDTNIDAGSLDLRSSFGLGSTTNAQGYGVGLASTNVASGAQLLLGDANYGGLSGNVNIPAGETINIAGNGTATSVGAIRSGYWRNTINGPINLTGNATINNYAGNNYSYYLTLAGTINLSTFSLNLTSVGNFGYTDAATYVTGQVIGSGGLNVGKDQGTGLYAGRVILTNATNSYSGVTNVYRGELRVTANGALGSTAGNTVVWYNTGLGYYGSLELDGGLNYSIQEPLSLAGIGEYNLSVYDGYSITNPTTGGTWGALRSTSGDNSFSGPITLTAATTISVAAGSRLTLNNPGTVIGESGSFRALRKEGFGELVLAGGSNYSGLTTVGAGTLTVTADSALGTDDFGTDVRAGATLKLQVGGGYTPPELLILAGSGFDGNGALQSVGNNSWAGDITTNSPTRISSNNAGTTLTINGGLQNDYALGIGGAGNIVVNGYVTGANLVPTITAGLIEGRRTPGWFDVTSPNPGGATQLFPRAGETTGAPWTATNEVWIYSGWFYDADGVFSFGENSGYGTSVWIDGIMRLYNTTWNGASTTGSTAGNTAGASVVTTNYGMGPLNDGWHQIQIYFGSPSYQYGAQNDGTGWTSNFGFGYSVGGSTGAAGSNYVLPIDPGDGSFFRTNPLTQIVKFGAGTLTFNGTNNTSQAPVVVNEGTFIVGDAANPNAALTSSSASVTVNSGGTLGGHGTIAGTVTVNDGTILPGMGATNDLGSGSVFLTGGSLGVQIGGLAAGTQYDQLDVTGAVNLAGTTLNLSEVGGFTPALGDTFTIVNNDGNLDSVSGTFSFNGAPLPDGGTVPGTNYVYQIDYNGGDGNDVVLTVIKGILITPINGLVTTEQGGTDTFQVVLTHAPVLGTTVTIDLSSNDLSEGAISGAANNSLTLTFTDSTWNVPQTVTITGVDDLVPDGDRPYFIVTSAGISADPAYSGQDPPDVALTNLDDPSDLPMAQIKAVQRYTTSLSSFASATVPIRHVDPTRAFVMGSIRFYNYRAWNQVTFELAADGNSVTVTKGVSGDDNVIVEFQVVEFWNGVRVQRGRSSFAAGDLSKTINLAQPVNTGKSFALVSQNIYIGYDPALYRYDERWNTMAELVGGGSQLELSRGDVGVLNSGNPQDAPYTVAWQVIEFTDGGTTVDHGVTTLADGIASYPVVLPPDTPNTGDFLFFNYRYTDNNPLVATGADSQWLTRGYLDSVSNASRITFTRGDGANQVDISWFVVHMPYTQAYQGFYYYPAGAAGGPYTVQTFPGMDTTKSISWSTASTQPQTNPGYDYVNEDATLTNRLNSVDTTGSYASGSSTITLTASNPNLLVGMLVTSDQPGIPAGTTITAISGANVTLSASTTAASTGTAFLTFRDPAGGSLQLNRTFPVYVDYFGAENNWFVVGFSEPLVSFETTGQIVNESSGTILVPVTLHAPITAPVTLNFSYSGTATPGAGNDYTQDTVSPVTFTPGGPMTQYIQVSILADGVPAGIEGNETIVLTLLSATGAAIYPPAGVHTITIQNGPPVAEDDLYSTNEGVPIDNTGTPAQGVIQNVNPNGADSDPDNDPLTVVGGSFPLNITTSAGGTVLLNANGTFQYTAPNADWFGTDTFTYQATDGAAVSNTATVFINVLNLNDAPQNLYNGGAAFPGTPLNTDEFTPLVLTGATGLSIADVDSTYNPALIYTVRLQSTLGTSSVTLAGGATVVGPGLNGSSDFTIQGTLADLNATLAAVTFTPTGPGSGGVTIETNDGFALPDTDTVPIDIADINNAPVPDNAESLTVAEGSNGGMPANQILGTTILNGDTDGGDGPGPLSIVSVSGTSVAGGTVTWDGTTAAYTPPSPTFNGLDSFTYVLTDDGGTTTATGTVNVTVTAVNTAPVNLYNPPNPNFPAVAVNTPEDTPLVFDAGNSRLIQVSDVDAGAGLVFVTLTSAGGTIDVQGDLVGVVVSGNGSTSVTLEGDLTELNEALTIIVFNPTPDLSGGGFLSISTNDQNNTGSGGPQVDSDIVPINIVAVNDRPVADLNGGSAGNNYTATFTEGGGPVAIVDNLGLTVSDVDNGTLSSATVSFVPPDGGFEVLSVTTVPGITVNYAGGVLTLTGPDTLANFQQVLRTLQYNNTSGAPSTTPRTINVVVDDGTGGATATNSPVAQITVNIVAQNTAPENRMGGSPLPGPGQTVAENTTTAPSQLLFNNANGNQLSIVDPDAGAGIIRVVLQVTNGSPTPGTITIGGSTAGLTLFSGQGTDTVTMEGTLTAINTAMNVVAYTPALNYNATPTTLTISTDDQGNTGLPGALTDVDTVNINITPVNTPPTANSDSGVTPDNAPITFDLSTLVSDVETPTNLLTYTIVPGSVVGGTVNLVGSMATFTPTLGFGGNGGFSYQVTDQGDGSAAAASSTAPVTVTVATFSTPATNITLSPSSVRERAAAGTVVGTLATVDPDPGDQHTYTLLNNPGGAFRLVNSGGVWQVVVNNPSYLDFEARRTITIRVQTRDLGGSTFAKNLVISLINVYERPIARDDVYTTTMNTPLSLSAARGVLRNDFKDASRTLRVTLVRGPRRGTLRLNRNGSFTYTPRLRFTGQDTFVYRISDGTNVDTAVVTINVRPRPLSGGRLT